MEEMTQPVKETPLLKRIILYTIPIILTGFLQLLFNAADLVVVGHYRGSISVGAVGATGSIINLVVNLFMGLSVGAGVRVAHGIGAQNDKEIHRTVHTSIPTAVISGIILTVIGVVFSEQFLIWMKTPSDVIGLSTTYMEIYFCGITANLLYNYGAAILRAAGDTKGPLIYLTIAGVLNIILNIFFVSGFNMNVEGVALATVISQFLSAVLVLAALMRRKDACRLEWKKIKIYGKTLKGILKIGVPAGIQGSMFSISNVIIQSSVNSFGSLVISGSAASANIEGFLFVSINAMQQTATNFVGVSYGAKDYHRIGTICKYCLACVTVVSAATGFLAYTFGRQLLSIYIVDSAQAIEYGLTRLMCIGLPYFLDGLMDVMTGIIRGMGYSLVPMILTIMGACVFRIVWIYTIFQVPAFHTLQWLFVSYPISWTLTFLAELVCFIVLYRKVKLRAIEEAETAVI